MRIFRIILFAAFAALAITACEDVTLIVEPTGIEGILVLNNGNWGANDASLSLYDPEDGAVTGDMFLTANNQHLGDLGQDMAIV